MFSDDEIYRRELVMHLAYKDASQFVKEFHCALKQAKTQWHLKAWKLHKNTTGLRGLSAVEYRELRNLYVETITAETARLANDPWVINA